MYGLVNYIHQSAFEQNDIAQQEMQKAADVVIKSMKKEFDDRFLAYDHQMNNNQAGYVKSITLCNEELVSLAAATDDFEKQLEGLVGNIEEHKDLCQKGFETLEHACEVLAGKIEEQASALVVSEKQVKESLELVEKLTKAVEKAHATILVQGAKVTEKDKEIQKLNEKITDLMKK